MNIAYQKIKKTVTVFCPSIEEGGVEKNLINIVNNLSKKFIIYVITANQNKRRFFKKNIFFISPNNNFFNKKNRILKSTVCIFLFLKNFFFKECIILSFQSNLIAILLAKILGKKIIIRSNTAPNKYAKNLLKRLFIRFFFKFSDKIIVNSFEFKKEFKKFFKIKPVVIYNFIESRNVLIKKFNKKIKFDFFDRSRNAIKLLSVGRLVKQKDHLTILKAISLIKEKKSIKFCLIGKGVLNNYLKEFIKKNNLHNEVKLIGYKDNVYPYYKKSDIFVLSSLYEGLPNVLIEALTMGLSIISSNCKTGPKEILKNGKLGKLFKIGDYKNLSKLILKSKKKKVKKILKDPRFNQAKILEKYKKLIDSIK